ncbi:hypothetical protein CCICO_04315 [Corynebacterium ciconiae DSM 44920]|uniref:polymer-forming cytoskeletal protein n=1 Tax=Corynebacterium ciconiae TaxID=227319 RepID=UPI0003789D99|nr:polymer-forming cytoskeletal protein [Corynebacterium ciconiae]WKD60900.1 hypothetical protein CCICO_04315 [Corynebacterium ciconiae DSM 44920]
MTDLHYEFTGDTIEPAGQTLHRIRATRELRKRGVRAGDLGGWVEFEGNLQDEAWVSGNARVYGDARVSGNAWVSGTAWVAGDAEVSGNARVSGDAEVHGEAEISGDAVACGQARVYGNTVMSGTAQVHGDAEVHMRARLESKQDILIIEPIGSEDSTITFARQENGHPQIITIGCWTGPLDEMADEVQRRSEKWVGTDDEKQRWIAEYELVEKLCRARMKKWAQ